MEEPKYVLNPGTRIVTHAVIGPTTGMLIKEHHLTCRKPNQKATIGGWVPGHGGDVYWAKHDQSEEIGAYGWWEFELLAEPRVDF